VTCSTATFRYCGRVLLAIACRRRTQWKETICGALAHFFTRVAEPD